MHSKFFIQFLPILIAFLTFIAITVAYIFTIEILNLYPGQKIILQIHPADVLVGLTIYLKTSIDFAILIGLLMHKFPGLKNRVAIEVGTAVGNALGTIFVLTIWFFFKEVFWLLALMIILASLVLFKLAENTLDHIESDHKVENKFILTTVFWLEKILRPINKFLDPVLSKIVPDLKFDTGKVIGFKGLFITALTIPLILGMDDFAGYVPLFNVVNVLGFGTGVFLGHLILNIFLFLNPEKTIEVVKNPIISILGSLAFVVIALWGFWEVGHLLANNLFPNHS
jgi:hypothetical protein